LPTSLTDIQPPSDSGDKPTRGQAAVKVQQPTYYCVENSHSPRLLTESRMFYFDLNDPHPPVCPVCNRQVSAQLVEYNAKGQPQIPRKLLELADRIGERV
jgi:hypothetical protein